MSDSPRERVRRFVSLLGSGDWDAAREMMHEDGEWVTPGRSPLSAVESRDAFFAKAATFRRAMPDGLELEATGWTVDGDRVAVEMESRAVIANGKIYENQHHFLFVFDGDRIRTVKEYMCSYHAIETFGDFLEG